jgi:hypothetical protein
LGHVSEQSTRQERPKCKAERCTNGAKWSKPGRRWLKYCGPVCAAPASRGTCGTGRHPHPGVGEKCKLCKRERDNAYAERQRALRPVEVKPAPKPKPEPKPEPVPRPSAPAAGLSDVPVWRCQMGWTQYPVPIGPAGPPDAVKARPDVGAPRSGHPRAPGVDATIDPSVAC